MEDSGATGEPDAVSASGLTGPGLTTTFLFAGGTVSVVCLLSVVWQYLWYPRLRRAPLNLLFWRSVADLLFTSQFCVTYIIPAFRVDEAEGGDKLASSLSTAVGESRVIRESRLGRMRFSHGWYWPHLRP